MELLDVCHVFRDSNRDSKLDCFDDELTEAMDRALSFLHCPLIVVLVEELITKQVLCHIYISMELLGVHSEKG